MNRAASILGRRRRLENRLDQGHHETHESGGALRACDGYRPIFMDRCSIRGRLMLVKIGGELQVGSSHIPHMRLSEAANEAAFQSLSQLIAAG